MVLALLKAGADPDVADEAGYYPLHYAANRGSLEAVAALLAKGPKAARVMNVRNGVTPLHWAVRSLST